VPVPSLIGRTLTFDAVNYFGFECEGSPLRVNDLHQYIGHYAIVHEDDHLLEGHQTSRLTLREERINNNHYHHEKAHNHLRTDGYFSHRDFILLLPKNFPNSLQSITDHSKIDHTKDDSHVGTGKGEKEI